MGTLELIARIVLIGIAVAGVLFMLATLWGACRLAGEADEAAGRQEWQQKRRR